MESRPHVELRGISKHFGGARALHHVDLTIRAGTVHGLVGENGAGKSTLGKIIAGVHAPDEGELVVETVPVHHHTPHAALRRGITLISQELALVPGRSVMENVFLGMEPRRGLVVDNRRIRARFAQLSAAAGFTIPGSVPVGTLGIAQQLEVEVLRALARGARLIVMDEPTAALTVEESEKLFGVIRRLRAKGTTIVYVSHFLEEVLDLADFVTVLRDGEHIRTSAADDETPERLVTAMLGRPLDVTFPPKASAHDQAPTILSVQGLWRTGVLSDISFDIKAGEIVGLAGLVGSGRSEVARAIFGADSRDGGTILIDGREVNPRSPRDAIRVGIAMLPESRKDQGLVMQRSILENATLAHVSDIARAGVVRDRRERDEGGALLRRLDVQPPGSSNAVASLSGGNQQKVLFAKWLFRTPRLLMADEPTRGVDIGAKRAIYDLITGLAAQGMGVLLISSALEEVLGLAHRVLVMAGGRIVAEFGGEASQDEVMNAAFELHDQLAEATV